MIKLRIKRERLFWVFHMYSKWSHIHLYKREAERRGDTLKRKSHVTMWQSLESCSHRKPKNAGCPENLEEARMNLSLEKAWLYWCADFSPGILMWTWNRKGNSCFSYHHVGWFRWNCNPGLNPISVYATPCLQVTQCDWVKISTTLTGDI